MIYDNAIFTQDFKRLLYNSKNEIFKSMWPEGAHSITTITKRPQTAGTLFKVSQTESQSDSFDSVYH